MKKTILISLIALSVLTGCGANTPKQYDLNMHDTVIYKVDMVETKGNETVLYTQIHNDHFDFAIADLSSDFESCESEYTDFDGVSNMHYVTLTCKDK